MTRTERLQLCRWAPEDFVSLEQVNENFTRLDAAGGSSQDAAATLRYNLAHEALQHLHDGCAPVRQKNLLTADFTKRTGQLGALHQLQNVYGTPMLIPSVSETFSTTVEDTPVLLENSHILCSFTPSGYGSVSAVTIGNFTGASEQVAVNILENGQVAATSETRAVAKDAGQTFPVSLDIAPDRTYTLQLLRRDAEGYAAISASGAVSVTFTGTVYETGYFATKPLPLGAGGVFELWVYYIGPAPAAAYSLDGGDYQALTPVETGSGINSDGEACSLLRFLIPDAAEKTLSLRFTLSSSDTLVRECCGILL